MRRPPRPARRAAALALPLSLALAACGGGDDDAAVDGGPGADADPNAPDAFTADCAPVSGTNVAFVEVASDFTSPMLVTSPPGDPRLFVVERGGLIKIVADGATLPTPFLDLTELVVTSDQGGDERGLLGLAFHPDYATSGRFYVFYTGPGLDGEQGSNLVVEYRVSGRDPDVADPASATEILAIPDPFTNHNGGMIAFGPDGYLYVGTGDGGDGGDPLGSGQSVTTLLGKILRIDVDGGDPYGVPADNPLVGSDTPGVRTEIWHSGVRNPWRWSFDRLTGELWIGDVGQGSWEEIDRVPAGQGGANLGWSDKEGLACFGAGPCATPSNPEPAATFTDPVHVYPNPGDAAVVGGYVYRGGCFPDLVGHYFFMDTYSSALGRIDADATPTPDAVEVDYGAPLSFPVSFGEDAAGELYVIEIGGRILRLTATP